jgi:molybdate/tungstate transport system substrate-binding protein
MMRRTFYFLIICLLILGSCLSRSSSKQKQIIVFHAGSLSVPFRQLSDEYEKRNPGTKILLEPAGSLVCARKVTELKKPCDIVASADYLVINELLIPEYAEWSLRFATNEMVIAFNEKSKYSSAINTSNWADILLRSDVIYSRSDPDSDPCGYRTILALLLAEKYYNRPGLAKRFLEKNQEYIRPKEVDLVALLETNAADYMFQYKSVAIQHNLKFISLPDEINLSDPAMDTIYNSVSVYVSAERPGSRMKVKGEYINYSMTILKNAPSAREAERFMDFILSNDGLEILRKNGQEPIIPFETGQKDLIPELFLKYLK